MCRKSRPFATLGQGIKHKIEGNSRTFATFKGDHLNTEIIAELRNRLQAPMTALEKLSRDEDVPKEFIEMAYQDLKETVELLRQIK